MRGIFPLSGVFMTSQYEIPPHTYRFPYRINMPLLILFWDAKQLGITFVTIASGNIFDFFITSVVVAVVFWFAYKKTAEEGIRGKLKHKLWWYGFFPGKSVFSSRYFTDPFIRNLYS
ncbi:TPA: plasmid transfer protein [Escherichia coli]|nr:plasmid transfer protein [Escherichia coli]HCT8741256.1 plasmid transfer protein [Escherichia coli]